MAASLNVLRRYIWLIDTIKSAGRITLEDINRKWEKSNLNEKNILRPGEKSFPKRTFFNQKQEIEKYLGIKIECNRSDNTYSITEDSENVGSPFLSWLLNSLSIYNRFANNEKLAERIILEKIPGGQHLIPAILDAISRNKKIRFNYVSFYENKRFARLVSPYGLKQWRQRWYLLYTTDDNKEISVCALERISELNILENEPFILDKKLDLRKHFRNVIGVNVDTSNYDPEKVIVRIYGNQRKYFESVPLHESQKRIRQENEFSDYEFFILPEYEFLHTILQQGENAEIISPLWLREEIKVKLQNLINLYKE